MGRKRDGNKELKDKISVGMTFRVQGCVLKQLFSQYRLQMTWIIVLSLITATVGLIELKFLEYITNSISFYMLTNEGDSLFRQIAVTTGLFLFLLFLMRITTSFYNIITSKFESKAASDIERSIVNKLSSISYEYYEADEFHEKMNLATQASGEYPKAIFSITQAIRIVVMLVLYSYMLSKVHWSYVVLMFLSVTVCTILAAKTTDKQLDWWRIHVSPESRRNNYFKSVFGDRINHQNIQFTRAYSYFEGKYLHYSKRTRANCLKLNLFTFSTELITSLLFMLSFCVTAIVVGQGVAMGRYEIGYYSMVIALLINLFSTVKQFVFFILNNNWFVRVLQAYYEVMELEERKQLNKPEKKPFRLSLQHITYQYPQAQTFAIQDISALFKMDQKIAVVGYNGSGKTTLMSIILELLTQSKGEVLRNEAKAIAVFQDYVQYQMSIKENIEIGCAGNSLADEKIASILKQVGLEEMVFSCPDGIYTKLGQLEDGVELSKGQWQRLAIGRLLANQQANVWILDEPTAFLDPLAEIETYRMIFRLAEQRLVFFISHRLGFAKYADHILVVNEGQIAEEGNHEQLMQLGGLYAQMFEAQKEWYM